ncbi:DUF808 domain-containing protein [Bisgaard Taxon 10/6]|uniref:DUF808 domain-containing protein n=1 Tax=Exercitatus varius TaxID=67857 RepID=A0ABT6ERM0_9PAST|nr:DUF808 domain-containing protein [Exercitatus varius]MDG2938620.1 DUF808 domain-containing protein [Exercitatus varius]MDG2946178.1 DUF808 domain-containing protein [Exercitatus varius]
MAFSSLFTLLDDIASVLDDVSVMTKVAAKKTVGVLSDDLALNANQVSGKDITPQRELPIVWAVAKGSFINKVILIPLALLLSIYLPSAINWLLLIGGGYLCFEGAEKLLHKFLHKNRPHLPAEAAAPLTESEKDKIKGAIRTDFILSAEIIIIALGALQETDTLTKVLSLCALGIGITLFVYGLVGLIVKLDDIGLWMLQKKSVVSQKIGQFLLFIMPWFMKSLSIIGTIAMFLVGGSIFVHYLPAIHHFIEGLNIHSDLSFLANFVVGLTTGFVLCAVLLPIMKLFEKEQTH